MVQHWEEETSKRNDKIMSCANYVNEKRGSRASAKDFSVSPLDVRAARDAWTAKTLAESSISRSQSLRGVERSERMDKLRRERDELVRKLGLDAKNGAT